MSRTKGQQLTRRLPAAAGSPERLGVGLVVGKFCPLHLGHEHLIATALARCERVVVLGYSVPGWPGFSAATRESWLRHRCPRAESWVLDPERLAALVRERGLADAPALPHDDAGDAVQRAFVAWFCLQVLDTAVDAVFTSEAYGDGFAATLSEAFSVQLGRPCQVRHLSVDPERRAVPARGRLIRDDPWKHREWMAPTVRATLVRRACVLGGESSGKTTLASGLARALDTCWVPEFGREHWHARAGRLSMPDLLHIARTQVAREETAAADARGWLIGDTSPLSTLFYAIDAQADGARVPAELHLLAARRYDAVILCAPDFAFVQDGTRRDAQFRQRQHRWTVDRLEHAGVRWFVASGPAPSRIDAVGAWLATLPFAG